MHTVYLHEKNHLYIVCVFGYKNVLQIRKMRLKLHFEWYIICEGEQQ